MSLVSALGGVYFVIFLFNIPLVYHGDVFSCP